MMMKFLPTPVLPTTCFTSYQQVKPSLSSISSSSSLFSVAIFKYQGWPKKQVKNLMGALWIHISFVLGCSEQFSKPPQHVGKVWHLSSAVQQGIQQEEFPKIVSGHFFLTGVSYGPKVNALEQHFYALFRDTPLEHVFCTQPNSQICQIFGFLAIWLFGCPRKTCQSGVSL